MDEIEFSNGDEPLSYFTQAVTVLACVPSYSDLDRSKPSVTITVGRLLSGIEPLTTGVADARLLATKLLVALATHDDEFAQNLLDTNFAVDRDGHFIWPSQ